jgi:hypothetical protein
MMSAVVGVPRMVSLRRLPAKPSIFCVTRRASSVASGMAALGPRPLGQRGREAERAQPQPEVAGRGLTAPCPLEQVVFSRRRPTRPLQPTSCRSLPRSSYHARVLLLPGEARRG